MESHVSCSKTQQKDSAEAWASPITNWDRLPKDQIYPTMINYSLPRTFAMTSWSKGVQRPLHLHSNSGVGVWRNLDFIIIFIIILLLYIIFIFLLVLFLPLSRNFYSVTLSTCYCFIYPTGASPVKREFHQPTFLHGISYIYEHSCVKWSLASMLTSMCISL